MSFAALENEPAGATSTTVGGIVSAEKLGELPPNCRLGANEDAFLGGFRLWVDAGALDTKG
jgi:hypothetical protein